MTGKNQILVASLLFFIFIIRKMDFSPTPLDDCASPGASGDFVRTIGPPIHQVSLYRVNVSKPLNPPFPPRRDLRVAAAQPQKA